MYRPALLVAVLTLSACGNDSKTMTIKDDDGKNVTISTTDRGDGAANYEVTNEKGEKSTVNVGGTNNKWPADAPAFAPAYPGGTITTVIASNNDGKSGGVIAFETGDAPAKVVAFYKALAEKAGLKAGTMMTSEAMNMFSAGDGKTGEMVVQATLADGKTSTAITYNAPAG